MASKACFFDERGMRATYVDGHVHSCWIRVESLCGRMDLAFSEIGGNSKKKEYDQHPLKYMPRRLARLHRRVSGSPGSRPAAYLP